MNFLKILLWMLPILPFTLDVHARAGGGGSSGNAGWIGILFAPFFILYAMWVNKRINDRREQVRRCINDMKKREPQWEEENLLAVAKDMFSRAQLAWGSQNLESLNELLQPQIFLEWKQQIQEQISRGERNPIVGLSLNNIRIVNVQNFMNDDKDNFTVCIDAQGDDQIIRNNTVVKSEKSSFREFWTFKYKGGKWQVLEVTQASGWKRFLEMKLVNESRTG